MSRKARGKEKPRAARRRPLRRVLTFLLVFALVYVGACAFLAHGYLSPLRHIPERPTTLGEVRLPGGIPAWATKNLAKDHPSPVVFVLAHGYGGTRDSWGHLMDDLQKRGIDAIAPAMPGQDASPAPQVGFGFKEADTMVAAASWIRARAPGTKIVYAGVSMGGAAAWLASEKDPTAAGVVTEGAYARFDEAMNNWFERKAPGASVYLAPVVWIASAMSGLNPKDVVPLHAAEKWKGKPALVIQAAEDTLIPMSHAERLAKASGAPLWIVPGATHSKCFEVARPEYLRRLVAFTKAL